MALTCLVGATQTFDAVAYARSMLEDDGAILAIPDTRLRWYIETVAEDFSRHLPLDVLVGTPYTNTSPFNTVAGQQRYVLNSTNGFTNPPLRVKAVQSTSGSGLNASNDNALFYLNPYATAQGFLGPAAIDSPSARVIRGSYIGELDWYGQTYYDLVRDSATGLPAFDLYPIPAGPYPIFVRYQAQHLDSGTVGTASKYVTIPEEQKRNFGRLLYAQVLFELAGRLALSGQIKLGQIEMNQQAQGMRDLAMDIRQDVYHELGAAAPVALVG